MAPPGPIPNPEVKHQHVDGSRTTGPARVDGRQGSNEAPEPRGSGASSVYEQREVFITRGAAMFSPSAAPIVHPEPQAQFSSVASLSVRKGGVVHADGGCPNPYVCRGCVMLKNSPFPESGKGLMW